MMINIGTVTVRQFEKRSYNRETETWEDLMPDQYDYEIVAVDKKVYGVFELAQLIDYWHKRLPYVNLDFQFDSIGEI